MNHMWGPTRSLVGRTLKIKWSTYKMEKEKKKKKKKRENPSKHKRRKYVVHHYSSFSDKAENREDRWLLWKWQLHKQFHLLSFRPDPPLPKTRPATASPSSTITNGSISRFRLQIFLLEYALSHPSLSSLSLEVMVFLMMGSGGIAERRAKIQGPICWVHKNCWNLEFQSLYDWPHWDFHCWIGLNSRALFLFILYFYS